MAEEVIRGTEEMVRLARRLKEAGNKDLSREMRKGTRNALKPLRNALPTSARKKLPRKNGLAEIVAKSKLSVTNRAGGQREGTRLTAKNAYSLQKMDEGEVRHPVYARNPDRKKWAWKTQKVEPGWATEPFEKLAPEARAEMEKAMEIVIAKLDGLGL